MGAGIPGGIAPNGGGGGINAGDYPSTGFPGASVPPTGGGGGGGGGSVVNITVNGALNALDTARTITDLLNEASGNTTSDIIGNWYKSRVLAG